MAAADVILSALTSPEAQRAPDVQTLADLVEAALLAAGLVTPPPPGKCPSVETNAKEPNATLLLCDLVEGHTDPHVNNTYKVTWTDDTAAGVLRERT